MALRHLRVALLCQMPGMLDGDRRITTKALLSGAGTPGSVIGYAMKGGILATAVGNDG